MSERTTTKILFLFEDELRAAARALADVARQDKEGTVDPDAVGKALNACWFALHGLHESEYGTVVMLGKDELFAARAAQEADRE